MKIINAELRAGVWSGELVGGAASGVRVLHEGRALAGVTTTPLPDRDSTKIAVPVPADLISDGVQTFVVEDSAGRVLASFAILAGEVLAHDLRAEIALLRAELDILKAAFRKHAAGG
ncbi:hypothetical protein [Yoonia sp.]|uniref:hypothetical protein n=1 Tax=Yoonia sp. TaxID=2212373 RepID=UPI002FD8EBD2